MFGMSFAEIMIIAVIAILFLGPDKLPSTMVQIAKFFKSFKSSVNDAKTSFEQEIKLQELKEETVEYKKKLDDAATSVRKTVSFDELEEIKKSTTGVTDTFNDIKNSMDKVNDMKNDPLGVKKTFDSTSTKEKGED
ncbi:Sec-independent protein translocase protein TatB [Sulfurospirillum arcachonense]|uniref:Sec-independent protein translocase protein TatB n=1 Tax=Sulfurospirillum arcachonense TaxID=57666 RepID=UPI0004686E66|nr:Sec-independent protein translocase protein TatB [Sulfurospirillum arcachonense]